MGGVVGRSGRHRLATAFSPYGIAVLSTQWEINSKMEQSSQFQLSSKVGMNEKSREKTAAAQCCMEK